MTIVIAFLAGLVVGGALVWFYRAKIVAAATADLASAKAELAALKAKV